MVDDVEGRLCLFLQRKREILQGAFEVLVYFSPGCLYLAERFRLASRDEFVHVIFVPIAEVRLDVHSLRMFGYQAQLQGEIERRIACLFQLALFEPFRIEGRQRAEFRHTNRSSPVSVNPRVADFRRNHRQALLDGQKLFGYLVERGTNQLSFGVTLPQICINRFDLLIRVRPVVITREIDRDGYLAARKEALRPVILLVGQNQFIPFRVAPTAKLRYVRNRRSRIDTYMQEADTCFRHRSDDAARMPRYVRHLGRDGMLAILLVQAMGNQEAGIE